MRAVFKIGPLLLILCLGNIFSACGTRKKSSRDTRREQIRNNAEAKRKELKIVAGEFFGQLKQGDLTQTISLNLAIKDIPEDEDGEIDPVMVPTLSGYLKFNYGIVNSYTAEDNINFSIAKAEFDPKKDRLDVVSENSLYKKLLLSLSYDESSGELIGDWNAPDASALGKLHLSKSKKSGGSTKLADFPDTRLKGDYYGIMYVENQKKFERVRLTLNTTFLAPDGIQFSASARLAYGDWQDKEFLTYQFKDVSFNPITSTLSLRDDLQEIFISGNFSKDRILGSWNSPLGKMGDVFLQRDFEPQVAEGYEAYVPISGSYSGEIEITNPNTPNFPKNVIVTLVVSEDLSAPRGAAISGSIRLNYSPTEYDIIPFSSIDFHFYTRRLIATTQRLTLTIKAEITDKRISGEVFHSSFAKIGNLEVIK